MRDSSTQDLPALSQEEKIDTQTQLEKMPERNKKPTHAINYPTNVLRLSRGVKQFTNTIPQRIQIVYYQSGVGVGDDFKGNSDFGDDYEKARGTATGSKIRDAYNFIAQNYMEGDKIYLFGFSRGAYTARKVAGLVCKLGLLSARQMGKFFHYWSALDRGDSSLEIISGRRAPIEFLGVWDTVGSVYEDLVAPKVNALTLVDSELPEGVKVARHALSYHENRKEFLPTPFANYSSDRDVKQVWFPGVHSDVGGSYKEHLIADITLCWMAGEAMNVGLTIDEEFLLDCFTITTEPNPELRLHFERHPNRALSILTVDRMAVLVKTPNSKEVLLTNVESRFLYHQSLWAEIRESSKGASHKAFPSKKNPSGDPVRAPLTDFEKRYWDVCKWNALLPLPVLPPARGRLPMARGSSPKLTPISSPSSISAKMVIAQHPVEFEMIDDYVEDMIENGTPVKYAS
ncbi:hypothetical protein RSOLAG1IB_03150 [Rhizoctonia solani AG-1 IB]|uniref:T6SS Phospholipase effector Tle1-like catalytic domain-containing protein n=2 Tax=Thanatephorus cucumeris (strain AG1-IB / isolate 7/3/14) TaxID=1108050 RepID=A0A0B7FSP7_THACB|nr:hypothetical protein RSOLAG1IB_03150 [Rhizoctonia solani AG-1 IB]